MKKCLVIIVFLLAGVATCLAAKDLKDEKTKPYEVKRVTKTVDGHHFLVPEDRPVEMIAGQYRPVDIDTYVAYKFGTLKEEMDAKFVLVEEKLSKSAIQSEKVLELEQEVKDLSAKVQDLTNSLKKLQEGFVADTTRESMSDVKGV
ncbi:MAG: hypothetical protein ABIC68_07760 [Candidatus Omnitrophota bacterium]